jgi:hypothetical protein
MTRISPFLTVFIALGCVFPAAAQLDMPPVPGRACGAVVSNLPFTIYASLATDVAGEKTIPGQTERAEVRHTSKFQLKPATRVEFCSEGPFYEGQRLEFTLRTMFPVFSCKTKIDRDIVVSAAARPEGGYDYSATCY